MFLFFLYDGYSGLVIIYGAVLFELRLVVFFAIAVVQYDDRIIISLQTLVKLLVKVLCLGASDNRLGVFLVRIPGSFGKCVCVTFDADG